MTRKWVFLAFFLFVAIARHSDFAAAQPFPEKPISRLGYGEISSVKFSPDGKCIACGTSLGVWLWKADNMEERIFLGEHADGVASVAFSPDGKLLASGSSDTTVRLWDVSMGKNRMTLRGHVNSVLSVAFSPDGKWLASGASDTTLRL